MGLLQFIAARFVAIDRRPAPADLSPHELGHYGEKVALAVLRRQGYRLITRNYQTPHGEIDLICRDQRMLVFVEVKTRRSEVHGRPGEAVGFTKQRKITRAATYFLQKMRARNLAGRFDVVEIEVIPGDISRCRIIRDAYSAA